MLKKEDPNTGLSEFLIRKLTNNYKIRSFKTGNKILIDYDSLMAFLQSQDYDLQMEHTTILILTGKKQHTDVHQQ